jgi:hypothetical protein
MIAVTSCSDIYDNIHDYVTEDVVYPGKLDGIIKVGIGFERVEIDLMNAGRIPSSQMHLGKAQKTIVVYDDQEIVIDSVCSWVNIQNLTAPKNYQFTIYTEDEFGNRSVPLKAEARPYTSTDLSVQNLPLPSVTESTSSALVEWKNSLSSEAYDYCAYSYRYTDKDGAVRNGDVKQGNTPAFFIDNVTAGEAITILMRNHIVPKFIGEAILDTIWWEYPVVLTLSSDAKAVIFLDEPAANGSYIKTDLPLTFRWIPVAEVSSYTLKLSRNATFPNDASTLSIPVGNVDNYTLTADEAEQFLFGSPFAGDLQFHWTVESNVPTVNTQTRRFTSLLRPHIISAAAPNVIDVRDFDLGGQGVGYSFSAGLWDGRYSDQYRRDRGDFGSPDVDIKGSEITIYSNEWLLYTVMVEDAGNYQVAFSVATGGGITGSFQFQVDNGSPVTVDYTGVDWAIFVDCQATITLPGGEHKIKVSANNGGDLRGMTLTKQ